MPDQKRILPLFTGGKKRESADHAMYSENPDNVLPFSTLLCIAWHVYHSFGMLKS